MKTKEFPDHNFYNYSWDSDEDFIVGFIINDSG